MLGIPFEKSSISTCKKNIIIIKIEYEKLNEDI